MWGALREKFDGDAGKLALGAGSGLDAMLASQHDLIQALLVSPTSGCRWHLARSACGSIGRRARRGWRGAIPTWKRWVETGKS